jgi:hypothetical protein
MRRPRPCSISQSAHSIAQDKNRFNQVATMQRHCGTPLHHPLCKKIAP